MAKDRITSAMERADRRDRAEDRLGISGGMTRLRDERNLRDAERRERQELRERQREERRTLNSGSRRRSDD